MSLKIRDVMVRNVFTVESSYTVKHAASIMNRCEIGCLVVSQNGAIVGIVTERDMLVEIIDRGRDPEKTFVREIMSTPVIVVSPETPLEEAVKLMVKYKIKKLPVMEGKKGEEKLVGLVTLTDIARFQPKLIETLKELFAKEKEPPPKRIEKVINYYIV
jgi:CBS domain-containing protein